MNKHEEEQANAKIWDFTNFWSPISLLMREGKDIG